MTAHTPTLHPWRPLYWEPVAGTGERLMVGLVYRYDNQWKASRILRDDVLANLYGNAAGGARKLIDFGLSLFHAAAQAGNSLEPLGITLAGLHAGDLRNTGAVSESELLRIAALLYSSLAHIDKLDEDQATDIPGNEEATRRFSTDLKDAVLKSRPELDACFSRTIALVEGGSPTRFGYASNRVLAQFNVLSPLRPGASLKDARARLFELQNGNALARLPHALLISATPRDDDPMLGDKQRRRSHEMREELAAEAAAVGLGFHGVCSASEGAAALLELEAA